VTSKKDFALIASLIINPDIPTIYPMDPEIYLTCFISLLVAINAPGVLPIFVSFTAEIPEQRKRIALQSSLTAFLVSAGFMLLGSIVFQAIGITVQDFMVAGGILLLVFSIVDIVFPESKTRHVATATIGVVPIGTPLLSGPATLTTTLVLLGNYGFMPVIVSLIICFVLAWLILYNADAIMRFIGPNGAQAFAKIASLLLAAIAVKLIRSGLIELFKLHG
jgi:multiple antibiotic resistance protein